jgi:hypothetical protein
VDGNAVGVEVVGEPFAGLSVRLAPDRHMWDEGNIQPPRASRCSCRPTA